MNGGQQGDKNSPGSSPRTPAQLHRSPAVGGDPGKGEKPDIAEGKGNAIKAQIKDTRDGGLAVGNLWRQLGATASGMETKCNKLCKMEPSQ